VAHGHDEVTDAKFPSFEFDVSVRSMAAAGANAIAPYIFGILSNQFFGWPAPVLMLVLIVAAQFFHAISSRVR